MQKATVKGADGVTRDLRDITPVTIINHITDTTAARFELAPHPVSKRKGRNPNRPSRHR